jgi:hypothetical protein
MNMSHTGRDRTAALKSPAWKALKTQRYHRALLSAKRSSVPVAALM